MVKISATDVVDSYIRSLQARDFTAARAHLADNLSFDGPIDHFDTADDFVKVLSELYNTIVKGVEHQATIAQGDSVVWLYLLDTVVAKAPVAEWHTVHGEKIVQIRAYFDARPFAPPAS